MTADTSTHDHAALLARAEKAEYAFRGAVDTAQGLNAVCKAALARAEAAEAEVARLRAALEWYADPENYDDYGASIDSHTGVVHFADRGERARATLLAAPPAPAPASAEAEAARLRAALEQVQAGAGGNAGLCMDCDSVAGLVGAVLANLPAPALPESDTLVPLDPMTGEDAALVELRIELEDAHQAAHFAEAEVGRLRAALDTVLAVLPDTTAYDDPCWDWCWNELTDDAQQAVKAARKTARAPLATPPAPAPAVQPAALPPEVEALRRVVAAFETPVDRLAGILMRVSGVKPSEMAEAGAVQMPMTPNEWREVWEALAALALASAGEPKDAP